MWDDALPEVVHAPAPTSKGQGSLYLPWGVRSSGHGKTAAGPLNKSINSANGCLTCAAIVSVVAAGFSPGIGFLHSGFEKAFACDIVDFYKFEVSVPLAFRLHSEGRGDSDNIRRAVRDEIVKEGLLERMIEDSIACIDAGFPAK